MGSIQRVDRPKPWLARYRGPDGRQHSRTFNKKIDAERWLRAEESRGDRGEWVDPTAGQVTFAEWSETWLDGLDLKPAPAYWGNTAYGIQTGCDSVPACRYGFIYQVKYLHAALEAYNSDARMLCDDDGDGDNMGVKCVPS